MEDKDEDEALDRLLKTVPPDEAKGIVKSVADMVMRRLKGGYVQLVVNESLDRMRQELGHSDAVLGAVEDLVERTGDSSEDVLLKAGPLRGRDKRQKRASAFVLVGRDYHFVREIIGFDQETQESCASRACRPVI